MTVREVRGCRRQIRPQPTDEAYGSVVGGLESAPATLRPGWWSPAAARTHATLRKWPAKLELLLCKISTSNFLKKHVDKLSSGRSQQLCHGGPYLLVLLSNIPSKVYGHGKAGFPQRLGHGHPSTLRLCGRYQGKI